MPAQMLMDFRLPPNAGTIHIGPIQDDDEGVGCDCCAQRLRCGICAKRYLGRRYAYYYRYDAANADGYMVGQNSSYEELPGPCCLPEDPQKFDELAEKIEVGEELIRNGEFILGSWGCLVGRIWIPREWPTGESPHNKRMRELSAQRRRRKR